MSPRRPHLTSRAAILAVVVCAIVLSLAYPLREYLAQQRQISELREQNQGMRDRIAALERRKRHLNDPDYVKRRARERLHFSMPGEKDYIVLPRRKSGSEREGAFADASAKESPWFVNLWRSVEEADKSG